MRKFIVERQNNSAKNKFIFMFLFMGISRRTFIVKNLYNKQKKCRIIAYYY